MFKREKPRSTWVYRWTDERPHTWTVGHYSPAGQWDPESDHVDPDAAAERVHWLNGGHGASES